MNEHSLKRLEYDKIKVKLLEFTLSASGRALAEALSPSTNDAQVKAWLNETEEAARLLAAGASVPLSSMDGMEPFIALLGKGKIYSEQELQALSAWLSAVAQMKRYMDSKRFIAPTISGYGDSMQDCPQLRTEIDRAIRHGVLTDGASSSLAHIRRQIAVAEDRIERRLNGLLSKYKSALQEQLVSKRNGHFVIPVKRDYRKQVPGTVWDQSASGQTLFVEPVDVGELQGEWQLWKAEEERERTIILAGLSELAEQHEQQLRWNMEAMASFDFIFARAKLALTYDGIAVKLADRPYVKLAGAKHPLLGTGCVPLHAELGGEWNQLIITGPNTGGKTVTLKTIGLLALMVQSGLLVPAGEGTTFGIFQHIMADVGDGQSIEQSLSTFSAHMASLKDILGAANGRSLVLLDELAAGTDPGEGIALSIAVLEELLERGTLTAATTHFNEIKRFASRTEGCINARMTFHPETLEPLYQLEIGEAGDSFAFAIARRFGLPERLVRRAEEKVASYRNWGGEDSNNNRPANIQSLGEPAAEVPDKGQSAAAKKTRRPAASKESGAAGSEGASKPAQRPFQVGDCVWIYPLRRTGIVYRPANERGEVIVQVEKRKLTFNRKRLSLYIASKELYPGDDYDMDIVFESKENRKLRNLMGRKYVPGLTIVSPPEEQQD
ncbi:DNA mismatch repair protein MutS [Paenibacillus oenotherae]|uniref:DNA mismatch repair protein MutS n=1 Tax=Paenibacillus oenotherae TaxID=1435645 RepID=A0ABS7DCC3_9BACL|nr:DNA mismatch repair protein MutS [Paenibacillus oenotherae]MBW7477589.1 DNA mismatch repair protein MutS [Paenibacillus oenotherae]